MNKQIMMAKNIFSKVSCGDNLWEATSSIFELRVNHLPKSQVIGLIDDLNEGLNLKKLMEEKESLSLEEQECLSSIISKYNYLLEYQNKFAREVDKVEEYIAMMGRREGVKLSRYFKDKEFNNLTSELIRERAAMFAKNQRASIENNQNSLMYLMEFDLHKLDMPKLRDFLVKG